MPRRESAALCSERDSDGEAVVALTGGAFSRMEKESALR